jgi:hypothetical protein
LQRTNLLFFSLLLLLPGLVLSVGFGSHAEENRWLSSSDQALMGRKKCGE